MDNEQMEKPIRVGSRKSELALIQTKHVIARLQKQFPMKKFEIHTMSTIGDRVLNISLPKIGEKSLFTRDLEDALRTGGVDFVVHSLKDLPTALPTGMAIGAVLEREDARDALVLNENHKTLTIETLPKGSVIGTSSLRRTAQIRRQFPHLVVCDIRGNLNTRLAKLDAPGSKFAGIVLAQAGLVRMGWLNRVSQILEPAELLYAVGQGALAIECRSNDEEILMMLQSLMCLNTSCRILAERSFLKTLGGGCSAPVAVWSTLKGDINDPNGNSAPNLRLTGAVWSLDGTIEIRDEIQCSLEIETSKENTSEENTEVDEEESNDEPPRKRIRESYTKSPESRKRDSPPVINDDMEVDNLNSYNFIELIETHAQLAKKCPYLGAGQHTTNDNNGNHTCGGGGGDADNAKTSCPLKFEIGQDVMGQCPFVNNETKVTMAAAGSCTLTQNDTATQNASKNTKASCPLKIEIGQDVMGQCPFVNNETKVTLAAMDNCPLTTKNENDTLSASTDITDHAKPSTSKCPFASMHNVQDKTEAKTLEKCPFLQKTVKMFDYADEEKPQSSSEMPILIEDVENLFCGMFRHECYDRELFEKSNLLGQQLAEELIKKGALDVMKCAQAEIHSKV